MLVMKPAEDGSCDHPAKPLDRANQWRILGQCEMWPNLVTVDSIGLEDPARVLLAQDHDVVQAPPADRADQPLRMSVLPGRASRDRVVPDAHRG